MMLELVFPSLLSGYNEPKILLPVIMNHDLDQELDLDGVRVNSCATTMPNV